ncbi:lytic transglycosylase domain-containing protein [Sporolactobacillus sp. KGMB 08714]|uniref:lytic transglycosylase domain-containing protein n=1 Tax=Sporolactobacillus sp. KGMB 08714 TaxID=3064704 RepID=UPI002FBE45B8
MAIDPGTLSQLLSLEISGNAAAPDTFSSQTGNNDFSAILNELMFLMEMPVTGQSGTTEAAASSGSSAAGTADELWRQLAASVPLSGRTAAAAAASRTQQNGTVNAATLAAAGTENTAKAGSPSYSGIIDAMSKKYSVDARLISSVIAAESGGNPNATSAAGAQGLMQLMPGTARSLGVSNAYDPVQNVEGGTKYLRKLLNQFGGNTSLAVAAYNAGAGNVSKYGGIPPFAETQAYVKRVLNGFNSESRQASV